MENGKEVQDLELQVVRQLLMNMESTVMALSGRVSLLEQLTQEVMRNQVTEQGAITRLQKQLDDLKIVVRILSSRDKARNEDTAGGGGGGKRLRP